jgi:hypothetical protein
LYWSRVVLEVVGEATQGALDKVRDTLPGVLRDHIDAGSSGCLR